MEQGEEVRYDTLNRVSYKYLVAVQLYAVFLQVQVGLDLGEVQDTRQVERIVHVQVYPEQGFVLHGIELTVE